MPTIKKKQSHKHKKFNNPFLKDSGNKDVTLQGQELPETDKIPNAPEDGEFIDRPDGTFAESSGIYIGSDVPEAQQPNMIASDEPAVLPFVGDTAESDPVPPAASSKKRVSLKRKASRRSCSWARTSTPMVST